MAIDLSKIISLSPENWIKTQPTDNTLSNYNFVGVEAAGLLNGETPREFLSKSLPNKVVLVLNYQVQLVKAENPLTNPFGKKISSDDYGIYCCVFGVGLIPKKSSRY